LVLELGLALLLAANSWVQALGNPLDMASETALAPVLQKSRLALVQAMGRPLAWAFPWLVLP